MEELLTHVDQVNNTRGLVGSVLSSLDLIETGNLVSENGVGLETSMSSSNFTKTIMDTIKEINQTEDNIVGNGVPLPGSGDLPWYGYMICITSMLFIWVVGSAGNFLVIYIVCKEKQLQTPINMFLVNLSFADFITSFFGSPFPLVASIMHKWPFGEVMCIIYGFGMSLGGITSITTLMVLSFERYLMIARPFRAADIKLQHSSAIIAVIWCYSLVQTVPPLIGWSSYGPEGPYISCSVSWEKDDLGTKTYICFLFVLGLVLPLITIVVSYVGIVTTIKSTSQTQVTIRSATARAELRVTAMVGVMITCFLFAWSPYAVVSLIVAFGGPGGRKLITPMISILPAIFAKAATCYNPLIYVGLNTQFQKAWFKLFGIQREDDENQTRLTLSATAVGGSTTGAIQSVSKAVSLSQRNNHSPSSSSSSKNSATQFSKSISNPKSIVLSTITRSDMEGKLNKPDNSAMSNTALELVPLTHQEPEDEQPQGNNDNPSSTRTTDDSKESA